MAGLRLRKEANLEVKIKVDTYKVLGESREDQRLGTPREALLYARMLFSFSLMTNKHLAR